MLEQQSLEASSILAEDSRSLAEQLVKLKHHVRPPAVGNYRSNNLLFIQAEFREDSVNFNDCHQHLTMVE